MGGFVGAGIDPITLGDHAPRRLGGRPRSRSCYPAFRQLVRAGRPSSSYDAGPLRPTLAGSPAPFVREYGWRAYALPLLVVITIVALMRMNEPGGPPRPAPPLAASGATLAGAGPPRAGPTDTPMMPDKAGSAVQREVLASDALPPGAPYTQQGKGTFHVVPGTGPVVGTGTLHRYTIDIEDGVTGINPATFATTVQAALDNPQSWTGNGSGVALQRVDGGPAEFHITLTSAMTVRALCGYELKIETSCYAAAHDQRVVLNVARWIRGDMAYRRRPRHLPPVHGQPRVRACAWPQSRPRLPQERARAGDDAADDQPQSGERQDLPGQSVALPAGRLGCPWRRAARHLIDRLVRSPVRNDAGMIGVIQRLSTRRKEPPRRVVATARGAGRVPVRGRGSPIQPPLDHSGRCHGRAEAAQERQGAVRRRRRARVARADVPRRRRRRHLWASSNSTWSTSRTCSVRSSTVKVTSAGRRPSRLGIRCARSTRS